MPWVPIAGLALSAATTAVSAGSSAVKGRKARKSEKELEEQLKNSPKYRPNQSILNYYDEALRKYNTSPTDTSEYKRDKQSIKQGTTQALSSLNKLRSGDVSNVIQGQNNSLLNAAVKAENRKIQEFGVLGQAAGMKAAEQNKAFNQNEIYPFEAKYNLLSMKAAGQRAGQRQETQNLYDNALATAGLIGEEEGGLGGIIDKYRFDKAYGTQSAGARNWAKNNNMNFKQYRSASDKAWKNFRVR